MVGLLAKLVIDLLETAAQMLLKEGLTQQQVVARLAWELQRIPGVEDVSLLKLTELVARLAKEIGVMAMGAWMSCF